MTNVLCLIHQDHVAIYGPQELRVTFANVPFFETVKGELFAEQWIDATLPKSLSHLNCPGSLRGTRAFEVVTPGELLIREQERELFETLDRIQSENVEVVIC